MPARTVVIERFTKFRGSDTAALTSGEYAQLTGRAGRRGIDTVGHAVVLWSPATTFGTVAAPLRPRPPDLRSSFRPTYNLAVNLVRRCRDEAHDLLRSSFGQWQAPQGSVSLPGPLDRRLAVLELAGLHRRLAAHRRRARAGRDLPRVRPAGGRGRSVTGCSTAWSPPAWPRWSRRHVRGAAGRTTHHRCPGQRVSAERLVALAALAEDSATEERRVGCRRPGVRTRVGRSVIALGEGGSLDVGPARTARWRRGTSSATSAS